MYNESQNGWHSMTTPTAMTVVASVSHGPRRNTRRRADIRTLVSYRSIATATEIETMESAMEKQIRDLKRAIKREMNPLEKSSLQFKLENLIKSLAKRDYREKATRFAGNAY